MLFLDCGGRKPDYERPFAHILTPDVLTRQPRCRHTKIKRQLIAAGQPNPHGNKRCFLLFFFFFARARKDLSFRGAYVFGRNMLSVIQSEAHLPAETMLWPWEVLGRQSPPELWCMKIGRGESPARGGKESPPNA